jgi:hypothetical protein
VSETPASQSVPRIWITPLGNTGNRALQYLVAEGIRQHLPTASIENIHLPEWGMVSPAPKPPLVKATRLGWDRFWIDVPGLADCLRRSVIDTLFLDSFSYNLDHYPPRATARTLFGPTVGGADATGFGPRELVCSIRGGEVLRNAHPDYIVLPPGYYRMLAERSGLDLVFFGQLAEDEYSHSLRRSLPEARFVPGRGPEYDFEMLRRSVNIAPSVSTFAWLAAWLSEAQKIFFPVGGLFSPVQHKLTMFLPLDDPSFEFILLPHSKAVDLSLDPAGFAAQQRLLETASRPVGVAELRAICQRARLRAPRQPRVFGFDPQFYLKRYPDVGAHLGPDLPSALEHYIHAGFRENRLPVDFDSAFYVSAYPQAAMAVAEGHFTDPLEHYMALGAPNGYSPKP